MTYALTDHTRDESSLTNMRDGTTLVRTVLRATGSDTITSRFANVLLAPSPNTEGLQAAVSSREAIGPTASAPTLDDSSAEIPDLSRIVIRDLPHPIESSREYVKATLEWEGYVEELLDGEFTAMLIDRATGAVERTQIRLDEISSFDQPLVKEGAVFYWSVGYRVKASGQREGMSLIRFRRLPSWTKRALAEIEMSAAKRADELGWGENGHLEPT